MSPASHSFGNDLSLALIARIVHFTRPAWTPPWLASHTQTQLGCRVTKWTNTNATKRIKAKIRYRSPKLFGIFRRAIYRSSRLFKHEALRCGAYATLVSDIIKHWYLGFHAELLFSDIMPHWCLRYYATLMPQLSCRIGA